MNHLAGFHAVEEALVAGHPLDRILVARGQHGGRIQKILDLARSRGVPVRFEDRVQLDRAAAAEHHQGVVAFTAAREALDIEDLLAGHSQPDAQAADQLLVLLDGIEDPHNVGAIVRTALAAGAAGLIIPERRAAGLTDTVARVSAGALAHLPVARVKNLARAMEQLKEAGFWLIGLDERAEKSYTEVDYKGRIGVVMGSEGTGLHDLIRKRCDFLVSIPTTGPVRSLNVSVAAGVVLFEALRHRRLAS
ncbi:MAG: 23S rRNA (guanosine(2251)-2'-O)-methyltransferase RlmB [Candidatus Acidiferrales bacterium]|jgi:23S rRNA (guanosine2251-2'-O)-methyltransferase|nr:23S rRNA (guanosine(2251)-2'-O)-methyltransferase RlmB [Candidatus Acidoferrales bacterium]